MATAAADHAGPDTCGTRVPLDHKIHPGASFGFLAVLIGGLAFAGYSIFADTQNVGETLALGAFAFLALALLIALGFEFVNGFHDTANAVATVIYTNSAWQAGDFAVVWSGVVEFHRRADLERVRSPIRSSRCCRSISSSTIGSGRRLCDDLRAAACRRHLEPRHLVFRPAEFSSSHALIGSILGVGLANQLLSTGRRRAAPSGVDWSQATKILDDPAHQPDHRLHRRFRAAPADEAASIRDKKLYERTQEGVGAAADGYPRSARSAPARPCPSRMAAMTGRRAWGSSCSS